MNSDANPYAALAAALREKLIGGRLVYLPSVTSTMDEARREIRRGAPEGSVVIAGEQTGGRGRLKRAWLTPAGNIALSICLYPRQESLPYLVMLAALAAAGAIEAATGITARLKWPNDVLLGGKKVGGILIESRVKAGKVSAIVGIGINTALRAAEIDEIAATATSLEVETGRGVNRAAVVGELLEEFERLYLLLPEGKAIYEAWRDWLDTLGRNVDIISSDGVIQGVAEAVSPTGTLLVRRPDGTLVEVVAGDVSLRERD